MECEFKWQITNPSDFDRIANSDIIAPLVQSTDEIEMDATYYDTLDGQIAKVRGGLRFRRENGEGVVCLKLSSQENFNGAFKQREEYECYAPDIRSGMLNLPSVGAPQDFCDHVLKSDLLELGRMLFHRTTYLLAYKHCTCELAFDIGHIYHRSRKLPLCEIELELKTGSEDDFTTLALEMQNKLNLKPQPLSKLARMRAL